MATVSASTASYYVRQQQSQPLKTLNETNAAILRTDRLPSYIPQCTAKRKSAVELLQETKSLYVKSETVLDRKQELRRSLRSSGSSDKGSSSQEAVAVGPSAGCYHFKGNCCSLICLPPPKSPRLVSACNRKSTADSQQLQNDLRRLLNADSKENLFEATSVFLDDVIVPPPAQYRRSASHGQHHQSCGSFESVAMCHKSLPDLTGVANPTSHRRHHMRSASSDSVDDQDDAEDDIFETYTSSLSPQGFGNVKSTRIQLLDEIDAATNVTSFPDSLSLTSYKTDARWQQSTHGGETNSSMEGENVSSAHSMASPTMSALSTPNRRPRSAGAVPTVPLLPPPPLPPVDDGCGWSTERQQRQPPLPPPPHDEYSRTTRPILRSKSDVGYRAPNLLSLVPANAPGPQQPYDAEQLENFFGHLGLDPEEYNSIMKRVECDAGSETCLSNGSSSLGSVSGGSNNNNNPHGCLPNDKTHGGTGSPHSESPSIVERNARIIKWLCNCRKVNQQQPAMVSI
ncbi:uncharacterized protein LOC126833465 [Adelges cooleyi]|uniref:uncharacterized protein LOC126833465 n=1 Tax=Adelges cooleyi TaxID=133065 RepID=UPI00217F4A19|nr:uncharacterized protein LOC126833465 [Adelges cooleyi]XP_050420777.1 uncharacterized protein LOC126833465 [Adelges cooleyi]XP_050420778.1 uncharacterized protein LOC126833465 [Adelges cooleyi]XP_050420779.1 uncharacterized protein LOC126833465 [Adelges cooleyi]XP_050420781.1 uncharacterized protein LOC126833465 [Adelges cooleyi]